VLEPLAEIAPDMVHPASGLSVQKMLRRVDNDSE
jgi:7,8-dihydro-6-hydroxymethylpterin-pyrophosphokinase